MRYPSERRVGFLIRAGLAAALVLAIAACAHPTPYGPAPAGEGGHGYRDQPLEDDRLRVTFSGNTVTPRETVENYLLFRAAEITLERGRDHFIIAARDTEKTTTYHTTYDLDGGPFGFGFGPSYGFHSSAWGCCGFRSRYYGGFAGGYGASMSWPVERYTAHADMVLGSGPKPAGDADAYDARAVIARLGPQIARRGGLK